MHPARGLMMGNRGCLHGLGRDLGVSRWRSKLWICCVLSWKGVRRDPMPPGRWTALFFLDEATALAAGHRPCAYCRRADYRDFTGRWQVAHGLAGRPRAGEMDARLHAERVDSRTRRQRTRPARLGDLPDAAMVRHGDAVCLVRAGSLLPWTFAGYGTPRHLPGRHGGRAAHATRDHYGARRRVPAAPAPQRPGLRTAWSSPIRVGQVT